MSTTAPTTDRPRRPWSPDGDDHLIFQWVKMEGKTQSWVASALGIDQSTVSRILQRYERWQAHAKEREGGRLDPAERLRAQRWLTFERNELILASCLRIAGEMEGFVDTSKSTISRPASHPSQETEIRTVHARIDRTGVAARFLRLAFRINMEQLKLAELDPPPTAEPLSAEELAFLERTAAADTEELAAARRRSWEGEVTREGEAPAEPPDAQDLDVPSVSPEPTQPVLELRLTPTAPLQTKLIEEPAPHELNPEPRTLNSAPVHNLHNLHNEKVPEISLTTTAPCTCASQRYAEEISTTPCIIDCDQPPWPAVELPPNAERRFVTAAAR